MIEFILPEHLPDDSIVDLDFLAEPAAAINYQSIQSVGHLRSWRNFLLRVYLSLSSVGSTCRTGSSGRRSIIQARGNILIE